MNVHYVTLASGDDVRCGCHLQVDHTTTADCGATFDHASHLYRTERGKIKACDGFYHEEAGAEVNMEDEMTAFPGVYRDTFDEALTVALNRCRQGSKQVIRVMNPTKRTPHYRFLVRPFNGLGEIRTRVYVKAVYTNGWSKAYAQELAMDTRGPK